MSTSPRYTLFITRDTDPLTGELLDRVDAWFVKPMRVRVGRGAVWANENPVGPRRAAMWSLEICRKYARTIPDDDRQCIRIEGDEIRGEKAA